MTQQERPDHAAARRAMHLADTAARLLEQAAQAAALAHAPSAADELHNAKHRARSAADHLAAYLDAVSPTGA